MAALACVGVSCASDGFPVVAHGEPRAVAEEVLEMRLVGEAAGGGDVGNRVVGRAQASLDLFELSLAQDLVEGLLDNPDMRRSAHRRFADDDSARAVGESSAPKRQ